MKLYLSNNVKYVKGKVNSALYNLCTNKVYELNGDAGQILDYILNKDIDANTIEGNEYINELLSLGLLCKEQQVDAEEIVEIKPRIKYVWLELTDKCNFNCLHCYGAFGHPSSKSLKKELSFNQWKKIIKEIRFNGCEAIQLIGGEPLLFKNFIPLLKYIKDLQYKVVDIFSNGYLISDSVLDVIEEAKANLRVSLYGYDSETHDAITQYPGSFKALDALLGKLKSRKIQLSIAVILMRENQDYVEKIKKYIESKGFRFKGYDIIRTVTNTDLHKHRVTRLDRLNCRYICNPDFSINYGQFYQNLQWNSCWFGKFAVTATGDILPCVFARNSVCGNILSDDREKIKNQLLSYWSITKDKIKGCSDCEFRYACGDCRPLAQSLNGDLYEKYPRCCYDVDRGRWLRLEAVLNYSIT